MPQFFEDTGNAINEIQSGFEIALAEQTKSERMRTELITNVSHDIKTPITSIINYVDLLGKENIESEKNNNEQRRDFRAGIKHGSKEKNNSRE